MQEVGLDTIETYIACHQNKIAQYIFNSKTLDMYLVEEWCLGAHVLKPWYN